MADSTDQTGFANYYSGIGGNMQTGYNPTLNNYSGPSLTDYANYQKSLLTPATSPVYQGGQTNAGVTDPTLGRQPIFANPAPIAPAPTAPNLLPLQNQLKQVQNKDAINKAMADYDTLYSSTKAMGQQTANTAGASYGNQLLQQGINPIASGVVRAQAMMPVYSQLADINTQKDTARLDYTNRADALAATIANNIGQLQQQYTSMLADYNIKSTGYNLDLNKFNAQQALESEKMAATAAASSASGSGAGKFGYTPPVMTGGYIPDMGPITPATINGREMQGQVILPSGMSNMAAAGTVRMG